MAERRLAWLVFAALLLFGVLGVHGGEVLSGFDRVPGDLGDARIMAFLLESGWRALLGHGSLASPPMFFPEPGTRAYTDAHLLWLPFYGMLRLAGLDMFRAMSALLVGLLCFGYVSAVVLFTRVVRLGLASSSVGAFLFVFGNALTIKLLHGQMAGVAVLPGILLLLHAAWRRDRAWPAVLAGLVSGLLAATSYIVAWFFLFIAGLSLLAGLVLHKPLRTGLRGGAGLRPLGGFACGLAIGLLPFLWIYLPQILHGPRRGIGDAFRYRPFGSDLLNLGEGNPVWSRLLATVGIPVPDNIAMVERFMGASPPVWLLVALGAVAAWRHRAAITPQRRALAWAGLGAAAATLVQFEYPPHLYLWHGVFRLVPGASAIRTTFRSELLVMLPVGAFVALALDDVWRRSRAVAVLLAASALLESVGIHPPLMVSARQERAEMAKAPPPPPGCAAFAISPHPRGTTPWYVLQSDALMLALHWNLPTVNGNSSWQPTGWKLQFPANPDYPKAVDHWIAARLAGRTVCRFDVAGNRFIPPG